jgi:hypothetical protein
MIASVLRGNTPVGQWAEPLDQREGAEQDERPRPIRQHRENRLPVDAGGDGDKEVVQVHDGDGPGW